jgi:hypothetical protein
VSATYRDAVRGTVQAVGAGARAVRNVVLAGAFTVAVEETTSRVRQALWELHDDCCDILTALDGEASGCLDTRSIDNLASHPSRLARDLNGHAQDIAGRFASREATTLIRVAASRDQPRDERAVHDVPLDI